MELENSKMPESRLQQLLHMLRHLHLYFSKLAFDIFDILLYFVNIHQLFFLKGINIPEDIQVIVVLIDVATVAVLVHLSLADIIGADDTNNVH